MSIMFPFILVLVSVITLFAYKIQHTQNIAKQACKDVEFEEHTMCITNIALMKEDASYCWAAGNFLSPWPVQCMEQFAAMTENKEACSTIFKPGPRKTCQQKFTESVE